MSPNDWDAGSGPGPADEKTGLSQRERSDAQIAAWREE